MSSDTPTTTTATVDVSFTGEARDLAPAINAIRGATDAASVAVSADPTGAIIEFEFSGDAETLKGIRPTLAENYGDVIVAYGDEVLVNIDLTGDDSTFSARLRHVADRISAILSRLSGSSSDGSDGSDSSGGSDDDVATDGGYGVGGMGEGEAGR